ncbi:MAG: hypothetical protein MZV49_13520 [Rhodopseudomonas palustris]|nr:hypothetical protein [Rhodopseudomonas palustris]
MMITTIHAGASPIYTRDTKAPVTRSLSAIGREQLPHRRHLTFSPRKPTVEEIRDGGDPEHHGADQLLSLKFRQKNGLQKWERESMRNSVSEVGRLMRTYMIPPKRQDHFSQLCHIEFFPRIISMKMSRGVDHFGFLGDLLHFLQQGVPILAQGFFSQFQLAIRQISVGHTDDVYRRLHGPVNEDENREHQVPKLIRRLCGPPAGAVS